MQVTRLLSSAKRRRQGGFTLLEVTLSLVIFTMMSLMFSAVLPVAVRGARHGNNYSQAAALAQRKVDQLRVAGYSRLFDGTDGTAMTKLSAQNIVDGQIGNSTAAGGTYDFTAIDHLTGANGFFPTGGPGATAGTIQVQDGYNGIQSGNVAQVTVTIQWGGTVPGTYTVNALLVSMIHQ